ncbi:hypothetical protein [Legionella clemsonensis]|uniref:Uncharacterized protein n=1 Tax=Legionella clemsonensis TaxID=1867846 RepID=A0A222P1J3_9GAMM|nr:hypothetical protein [Legionella clemsonensis]ASQ45722.1 hypothetical protein clem_05835 [Legionella clemsonensis]
MSLFEKQSKLFERELEKQKNQLLMQRMFSNKETKRKKYILSCARKLKISLDELEALSFPSTEILIAISVAAIKTLQDPSLANYEELQKNISLLEHDLEENKLANHKIIKTRIAVNSAVMAAGILILGTGFFCAFIAGGLVGAGILAIAGPLGIGALAVGLVIVGDLVFTLGLVGVYRDTSFYRDTQLKVLQEFSDVVSTPIENNIKAKVEERHEALIAINMHQSVSITLT